MPSRSTSARMSSAMNPDESSENGVQATSFTRKRPVEHRALAVLECPSERTGIADIKTMLSLLETIQTEVMKKGIDYGIIPGTPKPSLLKPGAELLVRVFNLVPDTRIVSRIELLEFEIPYFQYDAECALMNKYEAYLGNGLGSSNSGEPSYAFKWVFEGDLPEELKQKKEELRSGVLNGQTTYRIESSRNDIFGAVNAIQKRAKKRCLGSTTPIVVSTSHGIVRTNLAKMYLLFHRCNEPLYVPGIDGTWRKVVNMSRETGRETYRVDLNDGTHIRASPEHHFPTTNGLKDVAELKVGDRLVRCQINTDFQVNANSDGNTIVLTHLGIQTRIQPQNACLEFGWLVGIFLAEGSYRNDGHAVRFTLHSEESALAKRISGVASLLGSRVRAKIRNHHSNVLDVNVYGEAFSGLCRQFVQGTSSYNKHISRYAWSQGKEFLSKLLEGYLEGDGHLSKRRKTEGWIIGFTGKNWDLAEDIRAICAILGMRCKIVRNKVTNTDTGLSYSGFRGWINNVYQNHNQINLEEVTSIRKETKKGILYDVQVDGDHLFCLANGIQSHNSFVDAVLAITGVSRLFTQDLRGEEEVDGISPSTDDSVDEGQSSTK